MRHYGFIPRKQRGHNQIGDLLISSPIAKMSGSLFTAPPQQFKYLLYVLDTAPV